MLPFVQKFLRGEPYNLEGQQEVNEKNVRTFFDEIEEEVGPNVSTLEIAYGLCLGHRRPLVDDLYVLSILVLGLLFQVFATIFICIPSSIVFKLIDCWCSLDLGSDPAHLFQPFLQRSPTVDKYVKGLQRGES